MAKKEKIASILGLLALARGSAGAAVAGPQYLFAIANLDPSDQPKIFSPLRVDLKTFDVALGANFTSTTQHTYCSFAFNPNPPTWVLEEPGTAWTVDAFNGSVLSTVSLSSKWNYDVIAWDPVRKTTLAVGWPDADTGNLSVTSLDAVSGKIGVLNDSLLSHEWILPCQVALSASTGTLYYTQDWGNMRIGLEGWSGRSNNQTVDTLYRSNGAPAALAVYAPPLQPSAEHVLALDIDGGRGPQVIDIDPATGNMNPMITLSADYNVDSEGAAAWDPVGRNLWLALTRGNATTGVTTDLVAVNIPANGDKVTATAYNLDLPPAVQALFALNLLY